MSTKTVYQLDVAGHFAGETLADESPLEPGVWLIPRGCIEIPPPNEWPEDKWPRWNGAEWQLVTKPQPAELPDPAEKLRAFLQANPDVAALVSQAGE
ncbi:hypothetical protein LMG31506_02994 [Cupriavidus yeoncheonensis]|uniref:Phage tail protein n=1 Tax=Cupriavidus yeoncheonensis TaxID=1462994 RepID=A0A916ITA4_9BURK|nr:phage tail protein [Cupriavidus yeoncheonensis]CAG2144384.1 hypothetical protein LMG31506_02994 [Cupriavidus yeoncheonensis]